MLTRKNNAPNIRENSVSETMLLLEKAIDEAYKLINLIAAYRTYLQHLLPDHTLNLTPNTSKDKVAKAKLVRILARIFSDRTLFEKLMKMLPPDVYRLFYDLVWEQNEITYTSSQMEALKPPMASQHLVRLSNRAGYNPRYTIIPEHLARVGIHVHGKIFLPDTIRILLKPWMNPPPGYFLQSRDDIPKTDFTYNNENKILLQIHSLREYIFQTNLIPPTTRENITSPTLTRIAKDCGLDDFYDKKASAFKTMTARLMVDFLRNAPSEDALEPHIYLRKLFDDFFTTVDVQKGFLLTLLLSHINSLGGMLIYISELKDQERTIREVLRILLNQLKPGGWYSVKALLDYCKYHDLMLDIIPRNFAANSLTITLPVSLGSISGYQYTAITGNYTDVITIPFFKAFCFLLSTFGIVDIAYDYPKNEQFHKRNSEYLTVFDGLRYVRLTPLGAFVIGQTQDFVSDVQRETAQVLLDENHLLIYLDGNDPIKSAVLKQFGKSVGGHTYTVSYSTFLSACKIQKDINKKISTFKKIVGKDIPQIWQDFFKGIQEKITPLERQDDLVVYQVKQHPELIALISQDEILRQYVLKAENYHIIVHRDNLHKVRSRLEAFGFYS